MNIIVHVLKECLYNKFQKELVRPKVFTFAKTFVTALSDISLNKTT